ncbi:hypothetical protein R3W88_006166 [Solanum pinnatisectum]|uniref:Uncharacterized protein n=1 Tax=Solanum pinnatisectum TaxID=50273 RepID=A0AAV9KE12_9SOLN|nr:hypothetical protein R3W88_006166 [Solanum pinnatisectum]
MSLPDPVQNNCSFCDRYELDIYRDDNIMNKWDWSGCGENVFYIECKVDYILEKLNRRIDDDDEEVGHDCSPELIESAVKPYVFKFDFLTQCRIKARVICNILGICEDSASDVAEQVSTFATSQINDPQNSGCKIVPIVMSFTIIYVQHDGEDINTARARVLVNTNTEFRLPPIVPPPNPTNRDHSNLTVLAFFSFTLYHQMAGDKPPMPYVSLVLFKK